MGSVIVVKVRPFRRHYVFPSSFIAAAGTCQAKKVRVAALISWRRTYDSTHRFGRRIATEIIILQRKIAEREIKALTEGKAPKRLGTVATTGGNERLGSTTDESTLR